MKVSEIKNFTFNGLSLNEKLKSNKTVNTRITYSEEEQQQCKISNSTRKIDSFLIWLFFSKVMPHYVGILFTQLQKINRRHLSLEMHRSHRTGMLLR